MIEIRAEGAEGAEGAEDELAIRRLHTEAFGRADEAQLVDSLRANCANRLSLVALDGANLVGHILFTPATLQELGGMGLAPMAVLPDRQGEGIGSILVHRGLEALRGQACPFVIVLGHADYYPRFGFERACDRKIRCKWQVPDDAFMILPIDHDALAGLSGIAEYRCEFG